MGTRIVRLEGELPPKLCAIDGCREPVEVTRRPDGRWRVRHGASPDEESTRFYTAAELFTYGGYRDFVRELHPEPCHSHRPLALGYLERHALAARRNAAGELQRACPYCLRWLWRDEWGDDPDGWERAVEDGEAQSYPRAG